MGNNTTYICDYCGKFESDNLNDFTIIKIQKHPGKPLELYLCEEKCHKLFRLFWKLADTNKPTEEIEKIINEKKLT